MPSYDKRVTLTDSLLFDLDYFKGKFGSRTSYGEAFCERFEIFDDRILKCMAGNTHAIEYAKRYYIDRNIGDLKKIEGGIEIVHLPVIPSPKSQTALPIKVEDYVGQTPPPIPEAKKEPTEFEEFVYGHCGKKALKQMKKRGCPSGCTHNFEPDCLVKPVIEPEEEVVEEDTTFINQQTKVDDAEVKLQENDEDLMKELAEEMERILSK